MLLLTGKNTQILGGYVEDLFEKNGAMETALHALYVIFVNLNKNIDPIDPFSLVLERKQQQN